MSTTKTLLACMLLVFINTVVFAQASEWSWAVKGGGAAIDEVKAMSVDSSGNTYVVGNYAGITTFGSTTLATSGSNWDVFVAKMSATGTWLWAVRIGGPSSNNKEELAYGVAVDPSGNGAYVVGSYNSNTVAFGSTTLSVTTGSTQPDIFVAKISSSGTWQWAVKAGGTLADRAHGVVVDANSNIYITGIFAGTATFGAAGTITSYGEQDAFVAKLNSTGVWQWVRKYGGATNDTGNAIAIDVDANVYVGGSFFSETATFGSTNVNNSGDSDIFVIKVSSAGVFHWVRRAYGSNYESIRAIAVDSETNVYVTGPKGGLLTFGSITLSSMGQYDVFVAKLSYSGSWSWAKNAGGTESDDCHAIALDAFANVFVTGEFRGCATFGTIVLNSSSTSYPDAFLTKLNTNGEWLSAQRIGNIGIDKGKSVALHSSGDLIWAGDFARTVTIGSTTLTCTPNSSYPDLYTDIYVGRQLNNPLILQSPVGGESWIAGSTHAITWSASSMDSVLIDYSLDAGQTWLPVVSSPVPASPGTYSWTLPDVTSPSVKVRVSNAANPAVFAVSQDPFTIYIPLTLLSFNDGGQFVAETNHDIEWAAYGVSQVVLDYSLDAGQNWSEITPTPVQASTGSYTWLLPSVITETAMVRIRDFASPSIQAVSDALFTIYIPLILESMHGGENVTYQANTVQQIDWQAIGVQSVFLDYSLDGGAIWQPIEETPVPAQPGLYDWMLPDINCYTVKVRVRDAMDTGFMAASSGFFAIRRPLTMQSLLGQPGENYAANTTQEIRWSAFNVSGVLLDYSLDSGETWIPIITEPIPAQQECYIWLLPMVTSYNVRVRILDNLNPAIVEASQQDFAIIIPPTAPDNIQVGLDAENPDDFTLSWDQVFTDVNGNPMTPSGYKIYYCPFFSDDMADYILLATVTGENSFRHEGATQDMGKVFYRVIAFKE